jgi:hypothetical protein
LGLRSSRLIAAIPVRFQNFVASNRGQNLLSHFGEAGTAVLAVKQVEYGHDRTVALNITVDVREHHDFQNYYRPNFLAAK